MNAKSEAITIEAAGREVRISNPSKLFFPEPGFTKLDLVHYYLECEEAVVRHLRERPTTMKRWVDGVTGEFFFQKRVPDSGATLIAPTSCASTSTRRPACPSTRFARSPRAFARCSMSTGSSASPRPPARAAFMSTCGSIPSGASRRFASRRSPSPARSNDECPAARRASGGRRSASGSSSTTTRTRAIAPSPRPTRFVRWPMRGCPVRSIGRNCPTSTPPSCDWTPCRDGCATAAIRQRRSTCTPARSTACSSWRPVSARRACSRRSWSRRWAG